jgi:hypothetical protein
MICLDFVSAHNHLVDQEYLLDETSSLYTGMGWSTLAEHFQGVFTLMSILPCWPLETRCHGDTLYSHSIFIVCFSLVWMFSLVGLTLGSICVSISRCSDAHGDYTHRESIKLSLSSYRVNTLMTWTLISVTCQETDLRQYGCYHANLSHRLDLG